MASAKQSRLSLVSIIITCYNYAEFVAEAIESALGQTYENIEVIVIDDGSTDNSLEIINGYNDRVRVVSRANKGIVYTRNEGIDLAVGDYVCFLDADDYFDTDYIEKSLKVAKGSNADVVYPNWHVFGEREYYTDFKDFDVQLLVNQDIHCTVESLIRRSAIGEHRFESEEVGEDWDFFLGLALEGKKFKLAKDNFINYRVRSGTRGSARPFWDDVRYFYEILQKWDKRYPGVISPIDLPIAIGKKREEFIEEQGSVLKDRENALGIKDDIIAERVVTINELNDHIASLEKSMSMRVGRLVTSPLRLAKRLLKK